MKNYDVAITTTDVTQVTAESEQEAYAIALDIFTENNIAVGNYELDIIGIGEADV